MLKMEDRLKLVNASVAFYKTSEQVRGKSVRCELKMEEAVSTSHRGAASKSQACQHQPLRAKQWLVGTLPLPFVSFFPLYSKEPCDFFFVSFSNSSDQGGGVEVEIGCDEC